MRLQKLVQARLKIIYSIYMYKEDLVLINLRWLICHKTQSKSKSYIFNICV